MLGRLFTHSAISLIPVDLGVKTIRIPIARIEGKTSGKTLLVTAGNDGDEYAGIAAAYKLIGEFSQKSFAGTLIVIPIVNIPGFEAETGCNPLDDKFPKRVFPGNPSGTPTERLRYWLKELTDSCDCWVDLHGGSLTESIVPFLAAWRSGNNTVDAFIETMIACGLVDHALYDHERPPDHVRILARRAVPYLMVESGSFGHYDKNAIALHTACVRQVMGILGMIQQKSCSARQKTVYRRVAEHVVSKSGIWMTSVTAGDRIKKGDTLGVVRSLDGQMIEKHEVKHPGTVLWIKEGLRAAKGDIVAGIGY